MGNRASRLQIDPVDRTVQAAARAVEVVGDLQPGRGVRRWLDLGLLCGRSGTPAG